MVIFPVLYFLYCKKKNQVFVILLLGKKISRKEEKNFYDILYYTLYLS